MLERKKNRKDGGRNLGALNTLWGQKNSQKSGVVGK